MGGHQRRAVRCPPGARPPRVVCRVASGAGRRVRAWTTWTARSALAAEGFSDRQIAGEVGLSRTAVRKRRAKLPAAEEPDTDPDPWNDGDDEDDLALFDFDDDDPYVEPFTFCGYERVWLERARGEGGRWDTEPRYLDGNGRSLGTLDFWRWCTYREGDYGDYGRAERVRADMARQIEEYEARERVTG